MPDDPTAPPAAGAVTVHIGGVIVLNGGVPVKANPLLVPSPDA